jgi:hypothetical protein
VLTVSHTDALHEPNVLRQSLFDEKETAVRWFWFMRLCAFRESQNEAALLCTITVAVMQGSRTTHSSLGSRRSILTTAAVTPLSLQQ